MFPYCFLLFIPEAQSKLAKPCAKHECAAAQEYIAHLSHVLLQFIGNLVKTWLRIGSILVARKKMESLRFA
jgi:hypothetical protein